MSQENVEIVREAFAEFERGNFWVGDIFHPDVRIVWLDALAGGETESLGVESMAATVREWLRTWDRMTMTAERITVVGDEVRCRGSSATATALSLGRSTSTSSRPPNEPHDVGSAWKINPRCSCPLPRWARSRSGRHDCTARPLRPMADVARAQAPARTRLVRGCRSTSVAHRAPARTPPSKSALWVLSVQRHRSQRLEDRRALDPAVETRPRGRVHGGTAGWRRGGFGARRSAGWHQRAHKRCDSGGTGARAGHTGDAWRAGA